MLKIQQTLSTGLIEYSKEMFIELYPYLSIYKKSPPLECIIISSPHY